MQPRKKIKGQNAQLEQQCGPFLTSAHLGFIGIIQIRKDNEFLDFGLGILFEDHLVTLAKYFKAGKKPGRVYVRKSELKEPFSDTFRIDLGEDSIKDYEEFTIQDSGQPVGKNAFFVKFKMNSQNRQAPSLIAFCNSIYSEYASGLAIGFKANQTELTLKTLAFDVNQTHNLSLSLSVAVLLFNKKENKWKTEEFLYGFYDNLDNKERGQDYFLYQEALASQQQSQFCILNNHLGKVTNIEKHPYNSIGLLHIPVDKGYATGTASFLVSKDGKCRHIITCAHNFYCQNQIGKNKANQPVYEKLDFTSEEKLKQYKISIATELILEQPGRFQMEKKQQFYIQRVHIPPKYKEYVNQILDHSKHYYEKSNFPAISFQGGTIPKESQRVKRKFFWDIAVAVLKDPLQFSFDNVGFKIKKEKPFEQIEKHSIELTGFPRSEKGVIKNVQDTLLGIMYSQSTANHDEGYVRLPQKLAGEGWQILMHKLSTLSGNSGSPIYELVGNDSYLFGVHTTGAGGQSVPGQRTIWGTHNYGTYIFSQNIKTWLDGIEELKQILENDS